MEKEKYTIISSELNEEDILSIIDLYLDNCVEEQKCRLRKIILSRKSFIDAHVEAGCTPERAEELVDELEINWFENAKKRALQYLQDYEYEDIEVDHFTHYEAVYGAAEAYLEEDMIL